jgi:hypothetical protein
MTAFRLPLSLFVAAAGCMLAFGSASNAAPKIPAAHVPILQGLHQTRTLLHMANHDYDGYRAKAVHQVTKAIHTLDPPHPRTTAPKKPAAPPLPRPNEPQAVSDAQLKQAIGQLNVILNQLGSLPGDAHAATAMAHVRSAVADLNVALKIN